MRTGTNFLGRFGFYGAVFFLVLILAGVFSSRSSLAASESCTPQCPVFPHSNNCFVEADGKCKKKAMKMVTEEEPCNLWWGACRWGCFEDVDGKCKKKITKKTVVSEDCEKLCLP